jgi:hypothetical protein
MYHSCCAGEPAVSGFVVRIERLATALSSHDLSTLREDCASRFLLLPRPALLSAEALAKADAGREINDQTFST